MFHDREPPEKVEQKDDESAKAGRAESDEVVEQKEQQQQQTERDKGLSKTEANVEPRDQKKGVMDDDQPNELKTEVDLQAVETNEEGKQESPTPKSESKITEVSK